MKLLGRFIGSGYCTCRDCGRSMKRRDKRRQRAREKHEVTRLAEADKAEIAREVQRVMRDANRRADLYSRAG